MPVGHPGTHALFWQISPVAHFWPQPLQLFESFGPTQPEQQNWPSPHAARQLTQLLTSLERLRQKPPQHVSFGPVHTAVHDPHEPVCVGERMSVQTPLQHVSPLAQARPHAPQEVIDVSGKMHAGVPPKPAVGQ
jgi:hypothetical protein